VTYTKSQVANEGDKSLSCLRTW